MCGEAKKDPPTWRHVGGSGEWRVQDFLLVSENLLAARDIETVAIHLAHLSASEVVGVGVGKDILRITDRRRIVEDIEDGGHSVYLASAKLLRACRDKFVFNRIGDEGRLDLSRGEVRIGLEEESDDAGDARS